MTHATTKKAQWDKVNKLVVRTRDGDAGAAKALTHEFRLLIYKMSHRIYIRYGKVLDQKEIIDNARILVPYLTMMEYDPDGKATFTYFLQTHLHARLVQHFRPIATKRLKTSRLKGGDQSKYDTAEERCIKEERAQLADRLMWYVENTFSKREANIIKLRIMRGLPMREVSIKCGISRQSIHKLNKRCIEKLREYLKKMGMRKEDY